MKTETFNGILEAQIELCKDMLVGKAKEYATEDRLHNFKVAAVLEGCTPRQALAGMMGKHTVSIYDMCRSDVKFSKLIWEEKITDHLNYLFLLKAIVDEEIPHALNYSNAKVEPISTTTN